MITKSNSGDDPVIDLATMKASAPAAAAAGGDKAKGKGNDTIITFEGDGEEAEAGRKAHAAILDEVEAAAARKPTVQTNVDEEEPADKLTEEQPVAKAPSDDLRTPPADDVDPDGDEPSDQGVVETKAPLKRPVGVQLAGAVAAAKGAVASNDPNKMFDKVSVDTPPPVKPRVHTPPMAAASAGKGGTDQPKAAVGKGPVGIKMPGTPVTKSPTPAPDNAPPGMWEPDPVSITPEPPKTATPVPTEERKKSAGAPTFNAKPPPTKKPEEEPLPEGLPPEEPAGLPPEENVEDDPSVESPTQRLKPGDLPSMGAEETKAPPPLNMGQGKKPPPPTAPDSPTEQFGKNQPADPTLADVVSPSDDDDSLHPNQEPSTAKKKTGWRLALITIATLIGIAMVLLITFGLVTAAGGGLYALSSNTETEPTVVPPTAAEPETVTPPSDVAPTGEPEANSPEVVTAVQPSGKDPTGKPTKSEPKINVPVVPVETVTPTEPVKAAVPEPKTEVITATQPAASSLKYIGQSKGATPCPIVEIPTGEHTAAGKERFTLCGDMVTAKDGSVYVNGQPVTTDQLMAGIKPQTPGALKDYAFSKAKVHCAWSGLKVNGQSTCTAK